MTQNLTDNPPQTDNADDIFNETYNIPESKIDQLKNKISMEAKMKLGTAFGYAALVAAGFLGGMTYSTQHHNSIEARQAYTQVVKGDIQYDKKKDGGREIETDKLWQLYTTVETVFEAKAKRTTALEEMLR